MRFWRAGPESVWRVILQDPYSGKPLRFESLEGLVAFFQEQLGEAPAVSTPVLSTLHPTETVADSSNKIYV